MKLQRKSPFSGLINEMDIPMEYSEYAERMNRWKKGELIQVAFDNLTPNEREFIKTGITPEEWDNMFGEKVKKSS